MAEMRQNPPDVPYYVHESEMVRLERVNRRLWVICTMLGAALIAAVAWRR